MSDHPLRLTDDLITQGLRARSADPDLSLLDDIVRMVAATPQDRRWFGLGPMGLSRRALLIVAIALLLATMGAIAIGSRLLPPDPVPAEHLTVAGQIIEAANTRDPESLRSLMAEDGVLEFPSVDARAGREGEVYMSDWAMAVESFPEAWVGNLDGWGMEAHLGSCQAVDESTITCAVATRWHMLQIEIGEAWTFEFDGRRVTRLEMLRVDPDPSDRLLPMGLVDLSTWEAWLRETHPLQAARLLPSGPDLFGWMYFRFGLDASPDEIGASIDQYLADASPSPSTSPRPSPLPGLSRFNSTIHGISIDYPSGWQTRPATEPWTGGELSFDSPAADVIYDPMLGDRIYLVLASQPYGGLSEDEWRGRMIDWLCNPEGGAAFGDSWVDGADAFVITCSSTASAALIFQDSRGYVIRVATDEPGLAETYGWDWHREMLHTVDLRPEEALDALGPSESP